MKLKIGEKIKDFRKSKDITQEELAEMLGVSCQSVSRWELGTCYPDMELLPNIAEIFNISVDNLLGVDALTEKKKVKKYLERFQAAISKGKIDECIAIAREGVAEYPNNYTLLNKLMYALFVSGDSDGNIPEWKENMEKYDAEIISLGERIMKHCPNQDIRLEATARLAFQHCEMGRKSIGRAIYETLPSQGACQQKHIWWALEEEEKLPFLRHKIRQDYGGLTDSIWHLATNGLLPVGEAIMVLEKAFALETLICDGKQLSNDWLTGRMHCDMAKLYAELGDKEHMFERLKMSAKAVKAFDNRPERQSFSCLLLGEIVQKRINFDTSDTRPLSEIMRDKWLAVPAFDEFREEEEFQEVVQSLS